METCYVNYVLVNTDNVYLTLEAIREKKLKKLRVFELQRFPAEGEGELCKRYVLLTVERRSTMQWQAKRVCFPWAHPYKDRNEDKDNSIRTVGEGIVNNNRKINLYRENVGNIDRLLPKL